MSTDTSIADLFAPLHRARVRREQEDQQRYEEWLLVQGVEVVAAEVATERSLVGESAKFFIHGFTGRHAQSSNPRAAGMEPVFRTGRSAKAEKGMAQRIRAAAASLRAEHPYSSWTSLPAMGGVLPVLMDGEG